MKRQDISYLIFDYITFNEINPWENNFFLSNNHLTSIMMCITPCHQCRALSWLISPTTPEGTLFWAFSQCQLTCPSYTNNNGSNNLVKVLPNWVTMLSLITCRVKFHIWLVWPVELPCCFHISWRSPYNCDKILSNFLLKTFTLWHSPISIPAVIFLLGYCLL